MFLSDTRLKTIVAGVILILAGIATISFSITNPSEMKIIGLTTGLITLTVVGFFAFWVFRPLLRLLIAIENANQNQFDSLKEEAQGRNEFSRAPRSITGLVDYYEEKGFWYQSILDAIPFPLSVTDMQMNWTFINKSVEQFLNVKRENVLRHQCENRNANICRTENCEIARLRSNYDQTIFHQNGADFQVNVSYLNNSKGERVGHIEVIQDISKHVAVSKYQTSAVGQIHQYLEALSQGILNFEIVNLPDSGKYTREVRENFVQILDHLEKPGKCCIRQFLKLLRMPWRPTSEPNRLAGLCAL